jgi:hypothetical protein
MARFVEVFLYKIIYLVGDDNEDLLTCPFSCPFSFCWSDFRASRRPICSFSPVWCQQLTMWHVCVPSKMAVMPGGGAHSVLLILRPGLRALRRQWISVNSVMLSMKEIMYHHK